MNENRDSDLDRDLRAYRRRTDRGLPSVEDTARQLQARLAGPDRRAREEGFWMKSRQLLRARPAMTAAGALVVIALVVGIVPVSYERTTGTDVALSLPTTSVDAATAGKIADRFRTALGAGEVRVGAAAGATVISARVGARRGAAAGQVARAFAQALAARGIGARVEVTPVRERVSTSVAAYAMSKAIELRVERAGKTPAQMEADIRAQLEAAGIQNALVSVTQEGDKTNVTVEAKSANAAEGEREIKLELNAGGAEPLQATVNRFEVERKPGMTDADVKAEVERQMREAGVEGEVTVTNGQIQIKVLDRK